MENLKTTSYIIKMIVVSLVLFSCNRKKDLQTVADNNQLHEITVDLEKSKNIALSNFAAEVQYVKLETNKESLFAGIYNLIINREGIFIFDEIVSNKIFHFSLEGEFINTIGKQGRGPDEYLQAIDFIVDTVLKTVEIIDGYNMERFTYDLNGIFLRRDKFENKYISRFYKLPNGNYLVKLGDNLGPKYTNYVFAVLKPDLNTMVKEFILPDYPIDFTPSLSFSNPINNIFLFTYGLGDTIYQFRNDSLHVKYFVNYGKARIPDSKRKKKYDTEVISLLLQPDNDYAGYNWNLNWNQTHIFFEILSQKKNYLCCYNMIKKQNSIFSNIIGEKEEIYSRAPYISYNGNLIFSLDAMAISLKNETDNLSEVQKYGVYSDFKDVQKNTLSGDNPILVFMKPKNDL